MEIFDYKLNPYIASVTTDDLMDRFTNRVDWLIQQMHEGKRCSKVLAKSVFRVARELEHRGIRVRGWKVKE